MFPLLMIASRLSPILKSVSGSGLSLKGKTKETTTRASAEKQADEVETVLDKKGKEHAVDSPTGKMIINMTKEEEAPEMFGGMDLNKIKSALDEDSPLGMPAEVKGGVYKQIFEVNKMMLGSLQRIEGTLKLMLNLEYERALAFQQADVQQNLIEGDTDPDPEETESGPGRFRRGLSAAGSMLGGVYSKAKDSSIMKLLGLGALIFAFNKYKDEIIAAMAGILEYFSDVYDVFKSDGIGAAFDKVVDDFKTEFFPKIKEVSMGVLDFVWNAIKGIVTDFIYRNKGDRGIQRRAVTGLDAKENIMDKSSTAGALISSGDIDTSVTYGNTKMFGGIRNEDVDKAAGGELGNQLKELWFSMRKIMRESDYRIQFKGIPRKTLEQGNSWRFTPIDDILKANPIIDGVQETSWDALKDIELGKRGGITQSMDETRKSDIIEQLVKKTELAMSGASQTEIDAIKIIGQEFAPESPKSSLTSNANGSGSGFESFETPNKTPTQIAYDKIMKERAAAEKATASRVLTPNLTSIGTRTVNNVNASTNNNIGLSAHPTSDTVKAFKSRQLQELIA